MYSTWADVIMFSTTSTLAKDICRTCDQVSLRLLNTNPNVENRIRINKYVEAQPSAKTIEIFPISLKGSKKLLDVYNLPTSMLFYNIRNGRFAAEYEERVKSEGGYLDPEDEADAKKIKQLLLDLNAGETQRTYNDLKARGQWNCGIITDDGYLIDGNRRKAIISKLYEDTGQERWKYLKVARLNEPIAPEDLWALEAGIQLGKDEIARYGPINEILKIREGIEAGMSKKSIVNALYGYDKEDEISDKIDRLELIEQYLKFIGKPKMYSQVKQKVEHFINLQNIIKECNDRRYDPDRTVKIKYATFQLIKEDIPHLEIRKIRQMVEKDLVDAISEIEVAGAELKPATPQNPISEGPGNADSGEEEMSITRTRFSNATDILDVSNDEGKEIRLLGRAEKNLRPLLDYNGNVLSTPEASILIKKIAEYITSIVKKSC